MWKMWKRNDRKSCVHGNEWMGIFLFCMHSLGGSLRKEWNVNKDWWIRNTHKNDIIVSTFRKKRQNCIRGKLIFRNFSTGMKKGQQILTFFVEGSFTACWAVLVSCMRSYTSSYWKTDASSSRASRSIRFWRLCWPEFPADFCRRPGKF